jgi:adenine-specific DNA-methyltransferase
MATRRKKKTEVKAGDYRHPESKSPMRPDVGTQAQFRKKKPPATYRYDSSLAPEMNWDGQNPARELGEWLLSVIAEASQPWTSGLGSLGHPSVAEVETLT